MQLNHIGIAGRLMLCAGDLQIGSINVQALSV
jgi:hypothetical protein